MVSCLTESKVPELLVLNASCLTPCTFIWTQGVVALEPRSHTPQENNIRTCRRGTSKKGRYSNDYRNLIVLTTFTLPLESPALLIIRYIPLSIIHMYHVYQACGYHTDA